MRWAVCGISLIVFGTLLLAAGIALGIIFPEVLVPRGFFNYHKYEEKDEYVFLTLLLLLFFLSCSLHGFILFLSLTPFVMLDRYEDPVYEDCENQTFNAFFFNITNAAEVLSFGATPNYQQVGPYNYTREVCKFNITHDDTYEYFKRYYKPYYLKPV